VTKRCLKCSRYNHRHQYCRGEETCPLRAGGHTLNGGGVKGWKRWSNGYFRLSFLFSDGLFGASHTHESRHARGMFCWKSLRVMEKCKTGKA